MNLHVSQEYADEGRFTLTLEGDLDMVSKDEFVTASRAALGRPGCQALVVDMAKVTFIDSTGIGGLVEIRREARESDRTLTVANPSSRVLRLLELTGLSSVFLDPGE